MRTDRVQASPVSRWMRQRAQPDSAGRTETSQPRRDEMRQAATNRAKLSLCSATCGFAAALPTEAARCALGAARRAHCRRIERD
jgi:hypothetical protein